MRTDVITEVKIDENGRLCIKPGNEKFTLIWRSATEVHWDDKKLLLYSPKPREWSYLDWFNHITGVIMDNCNCKLLLAEGTLWINVPDELKEQILHANSH
jgi:hypothetical protein